LSDQKSIPGNPALAEQVDLPVERKQELLTLERRLETANCFELLGVPNGATPEACKAAYYELSMRLHPDRFFGKNLGSFRGRIDKVFRALTEAQQTLTDREKRAVYERAHPELFRVEAPVQAHDTVRADDRARRIARHPYLAKAARQHELLGRARKALDAGQVAPALLDLQQLLTIDPQNAEAKRLMQLAQQKKDAHRGQQAYEEGVKHASVGDFAAATRALLEAIERAPSLQVCLKGHEAASRDGDWKSAKLFAQKWVEYEPRSAKARLALAEVMERVGLLKNAKREAEEALRLDPDNKTAKALAAKLRWA
jgi:curved DNA-binding protein CbpA